MMLMHLYQIGHQRSYGYAEDYLYNKNSTSILLMLSKYHEFWVHIFSFSKRYYACLKLQSRLQKEYQVEMDRESNKLFWTTLFHEVIFMAK